MVSMDPSRKRLGTAGVSLAARALSTMWHNVESNNLGPDYEEAIKCLKRTRPYSASSLTG